VLVRDTNGDGKADLVGTNRVNSQLLLGCDGGPGCVGGLGVVPAWTTTARPVAGVIPDVNADGRAEAVVTDTGFGGAGAGRAWLHLSDATGLSTTPVWATLGDSHYPGFGPDVVVPGDIDGDGRPSEFLITSGGRIYAFFPQPGRLATMQAGFAWPREDATQAQFDAGEAVLGNAVVASAAGDVDRDGFDDLVVGDAADLGETRPGRVHLMTGGLRPLGKPPFLPGARVCNLPTTGKPDITVDVPALRRSLYVEHVEFAPESCEVREGCVGAPGARRLLRFAASIANFGGAPAIIPGPDRAPELYRVSECTGAPELVNFAQYTLIDPTGATAALGRKQSIFMIDIAPNCIDAGPARLFLPDQGCPPAGATCTSRTRPASGSTSPACPTDATRCASASIPTGSSISRTRCPTARRSRSSSPATR
jgi:hypothetical protein